MKRNESFLVYGVTALLVVIIVVAVVFGEGDAQLVSAKMRSDDAEVQGAADLERMLNLGDPNAQFGDLAEDDELGTPGELGDPAAAGTEAGDELQAEPVTGLDGPLGTGGVAPASLDGISPEEQPSAELIGSERIHDDYRRVTVRVGDSLSQLVSRWCGSQDYLPLAEALNEDIDHRHLEPGSQIVLPWVSDEIVRVAQRENQISSTRISHADGKKYTVRGGDSLWRIARAATASDRQAANYVKEILDVNPGIVPEKLREGQQIVLP